jgi:hypothetical protein
MNYQTAILLFIFTMVVLGLGIVVIDFIKGRVRKN